MLNSLAINFNCRLIICFLSNKTAINKYLFCSPDICCAIHYSICSYNFHFISFRFICSEDAFTLPSIYHYNYPCGIAFLVEESCFATNRGWSWVCKRFSPIPSLSEIRSIYLACNYSNQVVGSAYFLLFGCFDKLELILLISSIR